MGMVGPGRHDPGSVGRRQCSPTYECCIPINTMAVVVEEIQEESRDSEESCQDSYHTETHTNGLT